MKKTCNMRLKETDNRHDNKTENKNNFPCSCSYCLQECSNCESHSHRIVKILTIIVNKLLCCSYISDVGDSYSSWTIFHNLIYNPQSLSSSETASSSCKGVPQSALQGCSSFLRSLVLIKCFFYDFVH